MINEILSRVEIFTLDTLRLKKLAPIYPETYEEMRGNEYFITSMVEFIYNGIRFKRHHIERAVLNESTTKQRCKERLIYNAELSKKYAVPIPQDDIVGVEK